MTDSDLMPFGKFKGEKLANVPGCYFIWLHDQGFVQHSGLRKYILDNMPVFVHERLQGVKNRGE